MSALNELIQSRLRESIPLNYHNGILWIANASWTGITKSDAVFKAYRELYYFPERQIRNRLGLVQRPYVKEFDEIRDSLRKLKRRLRGNKEAIKKVRTFYYHIDAIEHYLLT